MRFQCNQWFEKSLFRGKKGRRQREKKDIYVNNNSWKGVNKRMNTMIKKLIYEYMDKREVSWVIY